jgi:hypothetical protein
VRRSWGVGIPDLTLGTPAGLIGGRFSRVGGRIARHPWRAAGGASKSFLASVNWPKSRARPGLALSYDLPRLTFLTAAPILGAA